ncbi:7TM diverse intracellular signaling domain-containing protein [Ohtaekwangia sp.]|uniref:7TM diverse intracellular signaling domain-containing protein n=1 Tax=Ohtaekwangia sp. TaxID=2066019 RepID=UPI002FDE531E
MVWLSRLCLVLTFLCFSRQGISQNLVRAEAGVLNARDWKFQDKSLPLSGYWTFYDRQLLSPEQLDANIIRGIDRFFPGLWNKDTDDKERTEYGTYALRVLLPDSVHKLAVEIPQLYCSYTLWANGLKVASAGRVDSTEQTSIPKWVYQTTSFSVNPKDTLSLVLQISNFHHHKGGAKDAILLGNPDQVTHHVSRSITVNVVQALILLLAGLAFLIIYFAQRQKAILFFALLSLTWSVRCMFSNLYPVVTFYPNIDWQLLVKVEYFSLYFGIIWASLFLHHVLNKFSSQIVTYTIVVLNVLFSIYTLFTPVLIFSQWISLYLAVAGVTVLYAGILIVRGLLMDHAGSWFLVGGIITGIVMFGYDILAYNTAFHYNYMFLSTGYLMIFLLTAIGLFFQLGILKSKGKRSDVLTYDDLFKNSGS